MFVLCAGLQKNTCFFIGLMMKIKMVVFGCGAVNAGIIRMHM